MITKTTKSVVNSYSNRFQHLILSRVIILIKQMFRAKENCIIFKRLKVIGVIARIIKKIKS